MEEAAPMSGINFAGLMDLTCRRTPKHHPAVFKTDQEFARHAQTQQPSHATIPLQHPSTIQAPCPFLQSFLLMRVSL